LPKNSPYWFESDESAPTPGLPPRGPCPSTDTLRIFLDDRLSRREDQEISAHLDECERCRTALEAIENDPELRKWLYHCGPLSCGPLEEPELAHLIECLGALPGRDRDPRRSPPTSLDPPIRAEDLGTLAPYEFRSILGHGAMGIVVEAYDPNYRRQVAIKIMRSELTDPKDRAQFARGARAAIDLEHENVVRVFEVRFPIQGRPYLVMDYVPGPTLRERIEGEGKLSPEEAARICLQVAEGLGAAHHRGLVHRDIKPSNIILHGVDGLAKIADFGLARSIRQPSRITRDVDAAGTLEYMSPEHVCDPGRVDEQSDIYGLGATLYEALTGETPFRGNLLMILKQLMEDDPVPPRRLNEVIPRDLEAICLKCLRKEPHRRYASAAALAEDLRRFLAGVPIRARVFAWRKFGWRSGWKWARQNPLAVAGLVVLLAIVVASAGGRRSPSARMGATSPRLEQMGASSTLTAGPPGPGTGCGCRHRQRVGTSHSFPRGVYSVVVPIAARITIRPPADEECMGRCTAYSFLRGCRRAEARSLSGHPSPHPP
jgi:eukaryotic-like serine/threonine-protein kinase